MRATDLLFLFAIILVVSPCGLITVGLIHFVLKLSAALILHTF